LRFVVGHSSRARCSSARIAIWGETLARYQLFNLERLDPFVGAGVGY
jgi:hypothetical protein